MLRVVSLLLLTVIVMPAQSLSACELCQVEGLEDCCELGCTETAAMPTPSELFHQGKLTGDWLGVRTSLGEHGIGFEGDITQFYMGTVDGGLENEFRYGGLGDYVVNVDASKLGGPQGLFVKIRAQHRFGESLGGTTGALLPSNIAADLPVLDSEDLFITNLLFTQALSENFAVFFGKLDTLDGDLNAFAHGRGKTQFSNAAFVVTPIALRTVVYSTLGAGFVYLDKGEPIFTFTLLNATDTASTIGLNELFNDGVALSAELRLPTEFFGLPGHQLVGGTWSGKDFVALDQRLAAVLPNIPIDRESDSWSLYWNFDQYFHVDFQDPTKGWGAFGRLGIGDNQTNPLEAFISFGVGGNVMLLPNRKNDTFGAGWYYGRSSQEVAPFVATALGGIDDVNGVEIFYNAQITPGFNLTADIQAIDPFRTQLKNALVVGVRAVITL